MKRPRRPVKRKVAPKKAAKPKLPKFRLTIGIEGDPFYVHPDTIPVDVALQWVNEQGNDNIDTARDRGWLPVKNALPVGGSILVWAPKHVAEAQRDEVTAAARKQFDDLNEIFKVDRDLRSAGGRFPLVPASFMVSSAYEVVPPDTDPVDVDVHIKFRITRRFQDAAVALNLSVEEYAQRRMSLYVMGALGGLLLPAPDGAALELHEAGNFTLQSRI